MSQSVYPAENIPLEYEKKAASKRESPIKKKKEKTQGIARREAPMPTPQVQEQKSLIPIEALTDNKGARKTFHKLFLKYSPEVLSDSNVQISLNEISCFFEALGQDYDASKGHGSHKKATLNFQDRGIDMEEQMIILTNKTYLKPEQIKDIRLAFVRARIVPNDPEVIEKLKKDGELE